MFIYLSYTHLSYREQLSNVEHRGLITSTQNQISSDLGSATLGAARIATLEAEIKQNKVRGDVNCVPTLYMNYFV